MPPPRRLWCSCVIIGYLAGEDALKEHCPRIIEQARAGELEIVVSSVAMAEAAYLKGLPPEESEARLQEFFTRDYIVPAAVDPTVARVARRHIRERGLKTLDAIHLATADVWRIPVLETTDTDLLRLDGQVGSSSIRIRRPLYEGPRRLLC